MNPKFWLFFTILIDQTSEFKILAESKVLESKNTQFKSLEG